MELCPSTLDFGSRRAVLSLLAILCNSALEIINDERIDNYWNRYLHFISTILGQ